MVANARVSDTGDIVDIGIGEERIAAIEPHIEAEGARVLDAAGRVVLHGFVEPHTCQHRTVRYGGFCG